MANPNLPMLVVGHVDELDKLGAHALRRQVKVVNLQRHRLLPIDRQRPHLQQVLGNREGGGAEHAG